MSPESVFSETSQCSTMPVAAGLNIPNTHTLLTLAKKKIPHIKNDKIQNFTAECIEDVVNFSQQICGFSQLPIQDQAMLITSSGFAVMVSTSNLK